MQQQSFGCGGEGTDSLDLHLHLVAVKILSSTEQSSLEMQSAVGLHTCNDC